MERDAMGSKETIKETVRQNHARAALVVNQESNFVLRNGGSCGKSDHIEFVL
jgi:hypothetical protein